MVQRKEAAEAALTKTELACTMQVSKGTVSKWNREGCPRFYVGVSHGCGSRPRYYLEQVKTWLEQRTAATRKELAK